MAEIEQPKTMKAVHWEGKPFSVAVREVPIPKILHPEDAIVRITTAAICGSDLHFYNGRWDMINTIVGHEGIGIISEVGSSVTGVKKGDRVVVNADFEEPLDNGNDIDRGFPGVGEFAGLAAHQGSQAEYQRVPWAAHNLKIVPPGKGNELDYLLLADIWPTAWFALESAEQVIGDTVAIFGAGPVGLLAAYSALLRGATRVYVVDRVPARLALAKKIGAIPINFEEEDPVEALAKYEPGGVDRSCECVGLECVDAKGNNVENLTIRWAISVTRPNGGIGVIGVFLPPGLDPKDRNSLMSFPFGEWWFKSLSIKGGLVDTRRHQKLLQNLIESGKAKPSFVFDRKFHIDQANEAYLLFSKQFVTKAYFSFDNAQVDDKETPALSATKGAKGDQAATVNGNGDIRLLTDSRVKTHKAYGGSVCGHALGIRLRDL